MNFDAVVFDLDGTISDSGLGITRSVAYAAQKMGLEVPSDEILRDFVGPSLYQSFIKYLKLSPEESLKAIELYRERHRVIGWKEARIYTGIYELLASLKRQGVHVALASSKPLDLCEWTLEYFGIADFFDRVSAPDNKNTSDDKMKLIKAALPDNCKHPCMVGDRRFDIEGAHAAGVHAVGVLYGYGSKEELAAARADELCTDVEALRRVLLGDLPKLPGYFITMEGADGCGKSTQHKLLYDALSDCGLDVIKTREPGGCPVSEKIRSLLLDVSSQGMTSECEALLFAAARAQHVNDAILPAVKSGKIVLCDRFVDSSIAYQGAGRELGDWVRMINSRAVAGCTPDLTLVFDLPPEEALKRRQHATGLDRIEQAASDFHARTYNAFIDMCNSGETRFCRVDASGSIEQIAASVRQIVLNRLKER